MSEISVRISNVTVEAINIYRRAASDEKFIDGLQAKLTPSQKEAIRNICNQNGLDMSTFAREAITTYIDLFPYKQKIRKHHRLLRQVLDGLS
jgi:hypothetical protein